MEMDEELTVDFLVWDDKNDAYVGKQIKKSDLKDFEGCFISQMAFNGAGKDYNEQLKAFILKCTPQTLDNIAYFFKTRKWRNPHLSPGHRLEFADVDGDFYQVAGHYLNLPTDQFEDPEQEEFDDEDDEEEEYNDDYPMGGGSDYEDDEDSFEMPDYGYSPYPVSPWEDA